MSSQVKRTYKSRQNRGLASSSIRTPSIAQGRKRSLEKHLPLSLATNLPPPKRVKTSDKGNPSAAVDNVPRTLTQLHFSIDQTVLRTCSHCGLTYTKGAPDDEVLHRAHCARVQKGMEWGREEEKERLKYDVTEVLTGVKLKDGRQGRIICFRADVGGKIGTKLRILMDTVNLALSSPPLAPSILHASKAYLFLLTPMTHNSAREKIAGCLIAQQISTAMTIASSEESKLVFQAGSQEQPASTPLLTPIDASTGVFCHPTPLPTPLGISRIFVSSSHRRRGIASKLLSAAAETFIHGCPLDPRKGHVAFTQPTGDGSAVMLRWGGGCVRIYED
ncbi:hypothetical protein L208DRAFT_1460701 [Tricholoma matsutake]|nr:hypothetical protein L208DRAFT_1460701 [Tricholoma matsutake 945]